MCDNPGGVSLIPLVIKLSVSVVAFFIGLFLWRAAVLQYRRAEENRDTDVLQLKKLKKRKRIPFWAMVIAGWFFLSTLISYFSAQSSGIHIEFELFSPSQTVRLFGTSLCVAKTSLLLTLVTGIVLVLALLFRLVVFPRFREKPEGFQNLMEAAVESMDRFTAGVVGEKLSRNLSPFMMSLAILMIGSAATELFGQRPPTSDLLVTITMGLVTLILINYYGIREKGLGGRIRSMGGPVKAMSPLMVVLKLINDISVPVSLACRLFGNMIGGMIVMDLLKSALGGYGLGIASVAGIWFNLFHPLIQAYIFIVLSLTFINEAAE